MRSSTKSELTSRAGNASSSPCGRPSRIPLRFRSLKLPTAPCSALASVRRGYPARKKRSSKSARGASSEASSCEMPGAPVSPFRVEARSPAFPFGETGAPGRSEEHTSELQSHSDLVCRLLLEKKKTHAISNGHLE